MSPYAVQELRSTGGGKAIGTVGSISPLLYNESRVMIGTNCLLVYSF
jgi:hypothetical protein